RFPEVVAKPVGGWAAAGGVDATKPGKRKSKGPRTNTLKRRRHLVCLRTCCSMRASLQSTARSCFTTPRWALGSCHVATLDINDDVVAASHEHQESHGLPEDTSLCLPDRYPAAASSVSTIPRTVPMTLCGSPVT